MSRKFTKTKGLGALLFVALFMFIGTTSFAQTYCTPGYYNGCTYGDEISNVTLDGESIDLNNSTGCSSSGYGNYTTSTNHPDLIIGNSYTISISTSYSYPPDEYVAAWIDYNDDGTFSSSEEIVTTQSLGSSGTINVSFTVSGTADTGLHRMRVRLAYYQTSIDPCTNYSYGEAEDYDVHVGTPPACTPYGVTISNITGSSAHASWSVSSPGPSNGYQYYLSTSSTPPTNNTPPTGSTSNTYYDLTGLSSSTTYYFWVRAMCSSTDTSDWTPTVSFTTTQIPATLPYDDGFESTPQQWTQTNGSQTNKWYIDTATGDPGKSMYISNDNGTSNAYTNSSQSTVQTYRDITFPATTNTFHFSFNWKGYGESCCDWLTVWFVPTTYTPTAGTQITTAVPGAYQVGYHFGLESSWQEESVILPNSFADSTIRLVFQWHNDGSVGTNPPAAVDNVHLSEITCTTPTGLSLTTVDSTHATISWNAISPAPGDGYQYYYNTSGTPPTNNTIPSGSTFATSVTLSGLSPNTQYHAWVRALCNSTDTSDWSSGINFTTAQIPATVPYHDSFETTPQQWTMDVGQTNSWFVGSATGNPGSSMYVSDDNGTSNYYNGSSNSTSHAYRDIALPSGSNSFLLSFDWKSYGESCCDHLTAFVLPSTSYVPTAGTMIYYNTVPNTIQVGGNNNDINGNGTTWNHDTMTIPSSYAGSVIRLVFQWYNDFSIAYEPPAAIDNVSVVANVCDTVSGLSADNITWNSADLNWVAPDPEPNDGYDYYYSTSSTPPTNNTPPSGSTSTTTASLTGLTASTQYYAWVRSVCGTNYKSSWTSVVFSTLCDTPEVSLGADTFYCAGSSVTLQNTDTNANGATFLWNTGATSSSISVNTGGTYWLQVTNGVCSASDTIVVGVHSLPNVSLGDDTAFCEGTSLPLHNYAFNSGLISNLWSTGATTSSISVTNGGNYWLQVTKNGCSASDTVYVNENSAPNVFIGNDTAFCAGDSIMLQNNLTNSGFTTNLWSNNTSGNSITISTPGTYWLRVTDGIGCSKTDSISIIEHDTPVVDLGGDQSICSGHAIILQNTATNSGNPSYLWSTGETGTSISVSTIGTYWLTVTTQEGCSSSDTIDVGGYQTPTINLGSTDTLICEDHADTLDAGTQPTGTTFKWNTQDTTQSIIVSNAGMYKVVANNHGCIASDSILISVQPLPHVDSITASVDINSGNYSFTPHGVQNSDSYYWYFDDGYFTSTLESPSHTFANSGNYHVILVVSNFCGTDTASLDIHYEREGIHQITNNKAILKLYPNPAHDLVTLENESSLQMQSVVVYNVLGQQVFKAETHNASVYQLHVSDYASGVYNVRVTFKNGDWMMRRFEITK